MNNLAVIYPNLVSEWHPNKNGTAQPHGFTPHSGKKVWWRCARGHEWQAVIASRTRLGCGCPVCAGAGTSSLELRLYAELRAILGEKVRWREKLNGFELDVWIPDYALAFEIDGSYWHADKENADRLKNEVASKAGILIVRAREEPLGKISPLDIQHQTKEAPLSILTRLFASAAAGLGAGYGKQCLENYIAGGRFVDEESYQSLLANLPAPPPEKALSTTHPQLTFEWSDANAPLSPSMFTSGSNHVVSWECKLGHRWKASIASRVAGRGCPFCSRRRLSTDFSLAALRPDLAAIWDDDRNQSLRPDKVGVGSRDMVWWRCPDCRQAWRAQVYTRVSSPVLTCPKCSATNKAESSSRIIAARRGSLEQLKPEVAAQWHPEKNGNLKPSDVSAGSGVKVWWLCADCGRDWQAQVITRHIAGCPFCAQVNRANSRLATMLAKAGSLSDRLPAVAANWHPTKNGELSANMITARARKKVWWLCPHCNHELQRQPDGLRRCPHCKGKMYTHDTKHEE